MKFQIEYWNNVYYCRGRFPDGAGFELKSRDDLTYAQWEVKYEEALDAHNTPIPEPDECQCPSCLATFVCPNRGLP